MGEIKQILKIELIIFRMTLKHLYIDIKNFDAWLLKIDKKSYKNIEIYNIGYIKIKKIVDCKNIHSVNPLYLLIDHVSGYVKEKGVNKYLVFDSTDENKKKIQLLT